jgi:imidazolonepropionase-like amidohydrolase
MQTLITGCRVFDSHTGVVGEEAHVLVEGERIEEISESPIGVTDATTVRADGKVLMPGLIDLHVHLTATSVDLAANQREPSSVITWDAVSEMSRTLQRGFTTVRDAGGADSGLARLVERGSIPGPRLFVAGRALSQTGGHGDVGDATAHLACGQCATHRPLGALAHVADGPDAVRVAVRQELRAGADQIKLMVSGGVASPTDPLLGTQYSIDEIEAAVEEATAWGTYVMAHAYSAEAIARAARAGVRTVEHVNLIDEPTAQLLDERGVYAVPTLVAYRGLLLKGRELGLTARQMSKLETVLNAGLESLEILKQAGVKTGFGSDLLGPLREMQSVEFEIRNEVLPAGEILAGATSLAAEVLGRTGDLGVIAPGALADLILVDGDPTEDISLLANDGRHLALIMANGRIVKNAT